MNSEKLAERVAYFDLRELCFAIESMQMTFCKE